MSEFYIFLFLFVVLCLSSSCALVRLPSLSSYFSIYFHPYAWAALQHLLCATLVLTCPVHAHYDLCHPSADRCCGLTASDDRPYL